MPMIRFNILVAATALVLTGCAQTPVQPLQSTPANQRELNAFEARGKLAWNQDGKGDSARFAWVYQNPNQHIDLLSPLGTVAATITAKPGQASLETAQGDQFTATSLEALSTRVFDMTLPLTGLEYWAQGLPKPNTPFTEETLENGKRITQDGFVLDYLHWIEVQGRQLPDQLDIKSQGLTLKLRIKEWSFNTLTP